MPLKSASHPKSIASRKTGLSILCVGIWLALLGIGMSRMQRYENTPGASGEAPEQWPASSQLQHIPGRATLIMFAHPKCPCTRASLHQLEVLLAENRRPVTANFLFLKPEHAGDDWKHTALWQIAAEIPGVIVSVDEGGSEASRFGGQTSGDVLFYDADGHLVFHGGITPARGQEGKSTGSVSLANLLAGGAVFQARSPVYGCPIHGPCPTTLRP